MLIKLKVHFIKYTFKRTTEKMKTRMTKTFYIKLAKIRRHVTD